MAARHLTYVPRRENPVASIRYLLRVGARRLSTKTHDPEAPTEFPKPGDITVWPADWLGDMERYVLETLTPAQRLTVYALGTDLHDLEWYLEEPERSRDFGAFVYKDPRQRPPHWVSAARRWMGRTMKVAAGLFTAQQVAAWRHATTARERDHVVLEIMDPLPLNAPLWKAFAAHELKGALEMAMIFLPQVAAVCSVPMTVAALRRVLPSMDQELWAQVFRRYKADLEDIIAAAPPLSRSVVVYKETETKKRKARPGFVFAYGARNGAWRLHDTPDYVQGIRVKAGARLLPLWMLMSEVSPEVQMLVIPPGLVRSGG